MDRDRLNVIAVIAALVVSSFSLGGCASSSSRAYTMPPMPPNVAYGAVGTPQKFEGIAVYKRTVTTSSPEAQEWFDQGLNWLYAFNHDEAVRAFTRATELDPQCAMAWWGIAYAQGPNYNDPMMNAARNEAAWTATQRALECAEQVSPVERALVHAITYRYANPAPEDRAQLDAEFAMMMNRVHESFPNDPDVGAVCAESMMTRRPWQLYDGQRNPTGDTLQIVSILEQALGVSPDHPGANHLYIHAVEPSRYPDRGLEAAERLCGRMPAAGHLEHMPSHIFIQTGDWEKAIHQNALAMQADDAYRALAPEQGLQHLYMVHNAHFLAFSAMMVGREAEAMDAARQMWSEFPDEALRVIGPFIDRWMTAVYDVQKRFGRWEELLNEPAPPEFLPVTTAIWRAHRAVAWAALKDFNNAERELEAFRDVLERLPEDYMSEYDMAHRVLQVSELFVQGELALQRGQWDRAADFLEQAIAVEDTLHYGEPPQYLQPTRHTLGAVYISAGKPEEAERVYREDLTHWRGNGWSLYGLARALEMQGRHSEAAAVREDFNRAWARADAPIDSSCLCLSGE